MEDGDCLFLLPYANRQEISAIQPLRAAAPYGGI
jgi:hypothetical protein